MGLIGTFGRGPRRGILHGIDVIEFALEWVGVALCEPADVVFAMTTPLTAKMPSILASLLRRKPLVIEVRDVSSELSCSMGIANHGLPTLMWVLEWVSSRLVHRLVGLSLGSCQGLRDRSVVEDRIAKVQNGFGFRRN